VALLSPPLTAREASTFTTPSDVLIPTDHQHLLNTYTSGIYTKPHPESGFINPPSTERPETSSMSILFLACLLAICLPILSVQLPRFFPTLFSFSSGAENGSPLHKRAPPLRRRVRQGGPAAAPRSSSQQGRRETTDGADSYTGGEETGSEEIHIQPPSTRLLMLEKDKGKGRADGKIGRKPWDPPLPRRETLRGSARQSEEATKGSVWAMPPTPPRKTGRDMEAKGVAVRLFPPDLDGDDGYVYEAEEQQEVDEAGGETTPKLTPTPTPAVPPASRTSNPASTSKPAPARKKAKAKSSVLSAVWLCVAILAVLLFILAFAILVAHCLAWFLVYKTEARLGEARRGIMQGGEMRLCLCAT
jgi:hypothetical protein